MPCYQGDLTHYSHHGIFPNVSGGNEALSVPAWGGVNMLSRIKMTRNPTAEDGQINVHAQVYGHLLIATHSHTRWLSSLPGDTEGPDIPMQAGLHPVIPGKPEPSLLGCQRSGASPTESPGCRSREPLALVLSVMARMEFYSVTKAKGSVRRTLVQLGDLWFCFGQHIENITLGMLLSSLWRVLSIHKTLGRFCPSQSFSKGWEE